jgi:hypothetical protein
MARLREIARLGLTAIIIFSLAATPAWSAPATPVAAMVVSADRARVGTAAASVGTTVYNGDRLETEQLGKVQVRTNAARLLLSGSSRATWSSEADTPAATLTSGTATFSTANSNAFALRMASAVIRPEGKGPTVGNVTVLNAKELVVRCSRGAVSITVDDDSRVVPEGTAYHVVLDPDPAMMASADAAQPSSSGAKPPKSGGRSKFIWFAIGAAAIVTFFAVHEALESPDRP